MTVPLNLKKMKWFKSHISAKSNFPAHVPQFVPDETHLARLIHEIFKVVDFPSRDSLVSIGSLLVILCITFWTRISIIDWDQGYHLHPDERAVTFAAQTLAVPSSLSEFFSTSVSTANPMRIVDGQSQPYPYGHFHLYLVAMTSAAMSIFEGDLEFLCPDQHEFYCPFAALPRFDQLMWAGRILSVVASTATVGVTYFATRRHYGTVAGVVASLALSLTIISIQNALFGTPDSLLALFCISVMYLLGMTEPIRRSIFVGLMFGLAMGCKVSGILLIFPIAVRNLLDGFSSEAKFRGTPRSVRDLLLTGLVALIVFGATNPYALFDPLTYIRGTFAQIGAASGQTSAPFTLQYESTLPIIYSLHQLFLVYLSPALTVITLVGFIYLVIRSIKAREPFAATAATWIGMNFVCLGLLFAQLPRYWLPVVPSLIQHGSGELMRAVRVLSWTKWMLVSLVAATSALWGVSYLHVFSAVHPWVEASEWIYTNIPSSARITVEQWDQSLPVDMPAVNSNLIAVSKFHMRSVSLISEPDNIQKLRSTLLVVSKSDYVVIASRRNFYPVMEHCTRFPYSASYYRALFSGKLGFDLIKTFQRTPELFGATVIDDSYTVPSEVKLERKSSTSVISLGRVDESFSVYDHPRVLIFKNVRRESFNSMILVIESNASCE